MDAEMRVYVGTYKKYNEGSIFGKWLNILDYDDIDEFYEACRELHKDEDDPEFMFQDWEYIPDEYISECSIDKEIFDIAREIEDSRTVNLDMFYEYVKWKGGGEANIVSNCEDSFVCKSDDYDSMIEEQAQETASCYVYSKDRGKDWILNHLDWDKIKDEIAEDYYLAGDYVFREDY